MWHFVVVTGASRGFGRAICVEFAKQFRGPVHFVITGRNTSELQATKEAIISTRDGLSTICDCHDADLADQSTLPQTAAKMFALSSEADKTYSKVIFVNNAGSLGPLSYIGTQSNILSELAVAINVNVTAACFLTSEVVRNHNEGLFRGVPKIIIVNISSLAAVQPFDSWGIYCAGKAARDMYHRVLAEEHKADAIKVLNYAPGPLDTDMQKEIRECPTVHKETQEYFRTLKEENKLVDCGASAAKLARLVSTELFNSGSHVDFFDSIEGVDTVMPTTCCGCSTCTCGPDCSCKSAAAPQCATCFEK